MPTSAPIPAEPVLTPTANAVERAGEHAALDAEVHHAGPFPDELAQGGEEDGGACVDAADEGLFDAVHARRLPIRTAMAKGAMTINPSNTSTTVPSRP